jgi:O-methyltransferase
MRMFEAVKTPLKRSFILHSAYKLARDFHQIPRSRATDIDALSAIVRVLPKTMLPMPRLLDLYEIVKRLNREGVKGNLVECGVWNGGAVGLMAIANRRHPGPTRVLHLYDSFEGLPQPTKFDTNVYLGFLEQRKETLDAAREKHGLTAIGACRGTSEREVAKFLTGRLGVKREDLVFHVGWFQDTVPASRESVGDIALLRLDGDWYESTKFCIENLFDKVVSGGFVVIDDYGKFEGCRRAVDEFLTGRRITPTFAHSDPDCVYFRKTSTQTA